MCVGEEEEEFRKTQKIKIKNYYYFDNKRQSAGLSSMKHELVLLMSWYSFPYMRIFFTSPLLHGEGWLASA